VKTTLRRADRRSDRRGAYTLVELLFATGILALVLGIPLALLRSSQRLQSTATSRVELQARSRRVLDRLAERLEGASQLQSQAVDGFGFQLAEGWDGANVLWSPLERFDLVASEHDPDDGVDNDSDGLVDELALVWTLDAGLPSELVTLLDDDIPETMAGETPGNGSDDNGNGLIDEPGLAFDFLGERIVVRVALEGRDSAGARVTHVAERGIALRN
jgi:type II secretory pathway pseudopilin PulG